MLGELRHTQIDALLTSQIIGRLGCHADDHTYVVPVTYAYDGKYIYGHTQEGKKIEMMRSNPEVCMEVDDIEGRANWRSAIVWGKYEELEGTMAEHALLFLEDRLMPLQSSETALPMYGLDQVHSIKNPQTIPVVYRIKVERKSGKFEKS